MITYLCWDLSLSLLVKGAQGVIGTTERHMSRTYNSWVWSKPSHKIDTTSFTHYAHPDKLSYTERTVIINCFWKWHPFCDFLGQHLTCRTKFRTVMIAEKQSAKSAFCISWKNQTYEIITTITWKGLYIYIYMCVCVCPPQKPYISYNSYRICRMPGINSAYI